MRQKTIRQRIYDHIKEKGPMTSAEAAEGLGIKIRSVSVAAGQMAAAGMLCVVGEKGKGSSRGRIYGAVEGAGPKGKGSARKGKVFVEPVAVLEIKEGESQRDAKIRTHEEHKASLCAAVPMLGGGPFGLMAAQLGATA